MKKWIYPPQVAEMNTPRPMDAAGECSLYHYHEFISDILILIDSGIRMFKISALP
jgi:hypothetical protein